MTDTTATATDKIDALIAEAKARKERKPKPAKPTPKTPEEKAAEREAKKAALLAQRAERKEKREAAKAEKELAKETKAAETAEKRAEREAKKAEREAKRAERLTKVGARVQKREEKLSPELKAAAQELITQYGAVNAAKLGSYLAGAARLQIPAFRKETKVNSAPFAIGAKVRITDTAGEERWAGKVGKVVKVGRVRTCVELNTGKKAWPQTDECTEVSDGE